MNSTGKWIIKFILALVFGLVFFLVGIYVSKGGQRYVAKSQVIVLAKDSKSAQNLSFILNNISQIPKSLAFFEKITAESGEIENIWENLAPSKKKNAWSKISRVKMVPDTSMLEITNLGSNLIQARLINQEIIKGLKNDTAGLYNPQNEVEIRTIGDIEIRNLPNYKPIVFGLAAFVIFWIFSLIFDKISKDRAVSFRLQSAVRKKISEDLSEYSEHKDKGVSFEVKLPASTARLDSSRLAKPASPAPIRPVTTVSEKKGAAPANLPIGTLEIPEYKDIKAEISEAEFGKTKGGEPSEDEVKKRLNALIKGEL